MEDSSDFLDFWLCGHSEAKGGSQSHRSAQEILDDFASGLSELAQATADDAISYFDDFIREIKPYLPKSSQLKEFDRLSDSQRIATQVKFFAHEFRAIYYTRLGKSEYAIVDLAKAERYSAGRIDSSCDTDFYLRKAELYNCLDFFEESLNTLSEISDFSREANRLEAIDIAIIAHAGLRRIDSCEEWLAKHLGVKGALLYHARHRLFCFAEEYDVSRHCLSQVDRVKGYGSLRLSLAQVSEFGERYRWAAFWYWLIIKDPFVGSGVKALATRSLGVLEGRWKGDWTRCASFPDEVRNIVYSKSRKRDEQWLAMMLRYGCRPYQVVMAVEDMSPAYRAWAYEFATANMEVFNRPIFENLAIEAFIQRDYVIAEAALENVEDGNILAIRKELGCGVGDC